MFKNIKRKLAILLSGTLLISTSFITPVHAAIPSFALSGWTPSSEYLAIKLTTPVARTSATLPSSADISYLMPPVGYKDPALPGR